MPPQLVTLNRANVLIPELMKEFHNLKSSEQNLYKELATLDSFKRSSEAALNEKEGSAYIIQPQLFMTSSRRSADQRTIPTTNS